jgi:hypothetical protein
VTDKGVASISGLKKLKNVYLWPDRGDGRRRGRPGEGAPGPLHQPRHRPARQGGRDRGPARPGSRGGEAHQREVPITDKDIDAAQTFTYKNS